MEAPAEAAVSFKRPQHKGRGRGRQRRGARSVLFRENGPLEEGHDGRPSCKEELLHTRPGGHTPCRRSTIQPYPFSPSLTRSRQLAAECTTQSTAQTRKNLATVLGDIHKDLLPLPNTAAVIEEDEERPPELSYSLGPLGEGGMADWFHRLQNPIAEMQTPGNNVQVHRSDGYVPPVLSPAPGPIEGACFGGCTNQRKGMLVWVPQNHISATSYHSGQQFASVQGSILWEYIEGNSGQRILVVDFGGNDRKVHVNEAHCRFDVGPKASVGGILEDDSVHYGELSGGLYDNVCMPFDWSPSGDTELLGASILANVEDRLVELL
jgi:hypothetical protein